MATRDEMFPSKYLKASDLKDKPITVAREAIEAQLRDQLADVARTTVQEIRPLDE